MMRRRLHQVRIGLGLLGNLSHHGNETIKCLLRLILRRLNHQTLVEEQGEVDRRCMITIVEQTLGHVHRRDTRTLVLQTVEHELMATDSVDRQFVDILQRLLDVVGIECGERPDLLDMLTTEREDIGVGTHHDAEVAVIG